MFTFEKLFHHFYFIKIDILIIESHSSESFSLFQKSLKVACKIPLYVIAKVLSNVLQAVDLCHIYFEIGMFKKCHKNWKWCLSKFWYYIYECYMYLLGFQSLSTGLHPFLNCLWNMLCMLISKLCGHISDFQMTHFFLMWMWCVFQNMCVWQLCPIFYNIFLCK